VERFLLKSHGVADVFRCETQLLCVWIASIPQGGRGIKSPSLESRLTRYEAVGSVAIQTRRETCIHRGHER